MAVPQSQQDLAPKGRQAVTYSVPGFVKTFASPGIDSVPDETGVFASGAGLRPDSKTFKIYPWDWYNESSSQGHSTEKLIGGFSITQAPTMDKMKVRRRGVDPFGGLFVQHPHSEQHPGGIVDMNPGADYKVAGGKGQASSMVRLNVSPSRPNVGMKLPVLPAGATRGGLAPIPTGGTFDGSPAVPVKPRISGWPTIFSFRSSPA